MAPAENPPRLPELLQPKLQTLHKVGWLERLRRWSEREQGGEGVSENGNGDSPTNGHIEGDFDALVQDAVQQGIKSVEARDPLSRENQGAETWLILGVQRSYDPADWSPDPRARAPIGSAERQAWAADPNRITALDAKAQEVYDFLGKLDEPSGFNDPN